MEEAQDLTHASVLAPAAMALPSLPGARLSEDRVATELGEEIRSPDECGSPIGSGDQETNKTYMEIRLITNFTSPTVASPVFKTDEEGAAFLLEKICRVIETEPEDSPRVVDGWLNRHFVRGLTGIALQRQKKYYKLLVAQKQIEYEQYYGDWWVRPLQKTDEKTESP